MKQIKHFVPNKIYESGTPACNCFQTLSWPNLEAFPYETAKTRGQVTCKNCRRTRVFRKLK